MNPSGDGLRDLVHATVVAVNGKGVLIQGNSGSGKTLLALEILSRCRAANISSALVADDYVHLANEDGMLIAVRPEKIARMMELRGFGPVTLDEDRCIERSPVALAVHLVPAADSERVSDPDETTEFCGVAVPRLLLPEHTPVGSFHAVLGWLGLEHCIV